jgi:hypothetical protein
MVKKIGFFSDFESLCGLKWVWRVAVAEWWGDWGVVGCDLRRSIEWYRFGCGSVVIDGVTVDCARLEGNGVRFQKKPDEGGWCLIGCGWVGRVAVAAWLGSLDAY